MNNVEFINETKEKLDFLDELKGLINYAIEYMNTKNVEFNIIFINNKKIHKMNREYRNIDRVTDVITFRLADYEDVKINDTTVLGDIYISLEKAKEQSVEYSHSYKREVAFLIVHGFLHLLGYDHMNKEDEVEMFSLQEEILDGYNIKR